MSTLKSYDCFIIIALTFYFETFDFFFSISLSCSLYSSFNFRSEYGLLFPKVL